MMKSDKNTDFESASYLSDVKLKSSSREKLIVEFKLRSTQSSQDFDCHSILNWKTQDAAKLSDALARFVYKPNVAESIGSSLVEALLDNIVHTSSGSQAKLAFACLVHILSASSCTARYTREGEALMQRLHVLLTYESASLSRLSSIVCLTSCLESLCNGALIHSMKVDSLLNPTLPLSSKL